MFSSYNIKYVINSSFYFYVMWQGECVFSGIRAARLFVWCLLTHVAQSNLLTIDWKSNNPFMVERKLHGMLLQHGAN